MANAQVLTKQSRVGKQPIPVPAGVNVDIRDDKVTVKGPKGEISRAFSSKIKVAMADGVLTVRPEDGAGQEGLQFQGLTWSLLKNMVKGVTDGFALYLDLHGVGYRAELKGSDLTMALGLSHQVKLQLPSSVKGRVETIDEAGTKRPRLHLESHDNEVLGQVAAKIKSARPPEPYKGKGIRIQGERIRQKAGKAGGKGK